MSPTKEEQRLLKEEAKAAKAQEREQARLAKAEAKAQRKADKAARKSGGDGSELANAPVEVEPVAAPQPRLELVLEPGPVKHMHWDAEERARREEEAAQEEPPADPAPPLQETPPEPQGNVVLTGRRRTLYTTENGNQVAAYDRPHGRLLTITEGGREVPFQEDAVDALVGAPETLEETVIPQETETVHEEPKRRGFFRRRKEEPVTAAPAVTEHVYRPVDVVETLPAQDATATAWEPSQSLQTVERHVSRSPRPTPRTRTVRKAKPAARKVVRRRAARKPASMYPGDNHPVIDIEGIGPVYAKKLEAMGITTTGLLGVAQPGRVAARLQVPRRTVKMWQAESELIKVRGIGPQYAEAMARAGIKGVDELKRRKADDIARQVARYLAKLDTTVVGQPVTTKRVARWKRKAKPMRRVKVNKEKLAVPTHGIPPPWLRESTKAKGSKTTSRTARKAARRPAKGTRTGARRAK